MRRKKFTKKLLEIKRLKKKNLNKSSMSSQKRKRKDTKRQWQITLI